MDDIWVKMSKGGTKYIKGKSDLYNTRIVY